MFIQTKIQGMKSLLTAKSIVLLSLTFIFLSCSTPQCFAGNVFNSLRNKKKSEIKTPSIPTINASKPVFPEIDRLDYLAHLMQLKFSEAVDLAKANPEKTTPALIKTTNAWLTAESILDSAIDDAWKLFPITNSQVFYANKIIEFAGMNLGIELRKSLGGNFHTRVPELINENGCKGDIVMDRLVINYFKTTTNHVLMAQNDITQSANILEQFARQIASLGNGQLVPC